MIGVAVFVLVTRKFHNVTYIVAAKEILIDTVLSSDLSATVSGYGQLSSNEVYWTGAESDGRIERILVH